jgi:hypothetical protein
MQRKKMQTSSRQSKTLAARAEREMMMKEAREIKKMINDAKEEAQAEGVE